MLVDGTDEALMKLMGSALEKDGSAFNVSGFFFFFSSRRRHTRSLRDWSSDVCSSDLPNDLPVRLRPREPRRLPPAGHGAPLRLPVARRDGDGVRARRSHADPDGDRPRLGPAAASSPRSRAGLVTVTETIPGDGFRLRRATPEDADFFLELAGHGDVEPFLPWV